MTCRVFFDRRTLLGVDRKRRRRLFFYPLIDDDDRGATKTVVGFLNARVDLSTTASASASASDDEDGAESDSNRRRRVDVCRVGLSMSIDDGTDYDDDDDGRHRASDSSIARVVPDGHPRVVYPPSSALSLFLCRRPPPL